MNNDDISLSNSMCCYLVSMASTEFTQNLYIRLPTKTLITSKTEKSKDKKFMLHAGLGGSHSGFVGDFDLERIFI